MVQRYLAYRIGQKTNTGPKAVDRQKAWLGELPSHAISNRTWFLPGISSQVWYKRNSNYRNGIDTVEHTFFECPMWVPERQQAERIIGHVTPITMVASIFENEGNWKLVETMVRKIMESHESRDRDNMQSELCTE
ncbi:hypothetical protein Trydic_g3824 [Trypoxylus dichotomus]